MNNQTKITLKNSAYHPEEFCILETIIRHTVLSLSFGLIKILKSSEFCPVLCFARSFSEMYLDNPSTGRGEDIHEQQQQSEQTCLKCLFS